MYRNTTLSLLSAALLFTACSDDDETTVDPEIEVPTTYEFTRDGQSTVSFSGQTTRIAMAEALCGALLDFDQTADQLLAMYRNEGEDGSDINPFDEASLNESSKSIREKVAASRDFFSANTAESITVKSQFEDWIVRQTTEVFPNQEVLAEPGVAGQIADGDAVRYVSAEGLEYNQLVCKGLIGALMTDQILNHYLSPDVLDEGDARALNEAGTTVEGENYTFMEHKWDEAYGYVYGASADPANPNATLGEDDGFLNKYISRVDNDPDFTGIADDIFQAFKTGREAIVSGDYELRDQQTAILREKLSEVIAIRAVYYLQQGKDKLQQESVDYGALFHDLSEAYGFIYSLRFTRQSDRNLSYTGDLSVDILLSLRLLYGENGLWDVTAERLDSATEDIEILFDFTTEEARE